MRLIHLARLDTTRPVLLLTRETVRPHFARVTVAPVTTIARGSRARCPWAGPTGSTRRVSSVVTTS